ncbi:MAG: helix-turn-helix domain-containing protein [Polaribacter sp.]
MTEHNKYRNLHIIAKIIADRNRITPESIFVNSRERRVVDIRALFFYFATKYTKLSLSDIGKFSKEMGRDKEHHHASVLHNSRKIRDIIVFDKDLRKETEELNNEIKYYVDYYKFWQDSITSYKKIIVENVYNEKDLEFTSKLSDLIAKIFENREILNILADVVEKELQTEETEEENYDEGIYQATQKHIGLGVV